MTDHLWSPWRMDYINRPKEKKSGCVLCQYKTKNDKLVIHRTRDSFIVMNLYPYNNGHVMICPMDHVSDFNKLNNKFRLEMLSHISLITDFMKKEMGAQGFNVGANVGGAAGAGIDDHFHMHIVPRWNGDTNFMPVIGNTKVQVSTLIETCNLIKQAFK